MRYMHARGSSVTSLKIEYVGGGVKLGDRHRFSSSSFWKIIRTKLETFFKICICIYAYTLYIYTYIRYRYNTCACIYVHRQKGKERKGRKRKGENVENVG